MADLGTDIDCVTDVGKTWSIVSGERCLGNALARRLSTPRGPGLGLWYDPDYGTDVRSMLHGRIDAAALKTIAGQIKAECEKDERVARAGVELTFNYQTGTLLAQVEVETADGEFRLVLAISALTVELLNEGLPADTLALEAEDVTTPTVIQGPAGPPGIQGPPGAAGSGGSGSTVIQVSDPAEWAADGATSTVVIEELKDFGTLPAGTLTVELTAQVKSTSGTSTFRVYIGGTSGASDGTLVITTTTASGSFVTVNISGSLTNPTGTQWVKVAIQSSGAATFAHIKATTVEIRS